MSEEPRFGTDSPRTASPSPLRFEQDWALHLSPVLIPEKTGADPLSAKEAGIRSENETIRVLVTTS